MRKNLLKIICCILSISIIFTCLFGCDITQRGTNNNNNKTENEIDTSTTVNNVEYKKSTASNSAIDLSNAYSKVSASTVTVKLIYSYSQNGILLTEFGFYSGFVINESGFIATSGEIGYIQSSSGYQIKSIWVYFNNNTKTNYSADINNIQYLKALDFTIIKLTNFTGTLNGVEFANSDELNYGDDCLFVGSTFSLTDGIIPYASQGIVSKPRNNHTLLKSYFSTDYCNYLVESSVATNTNNDGGALVNKDGNIIGLISLKAEISAQVKTYSANGISLSIPSITIMKFLDDKSISYTGSYTEIDYSINYINSNQPTEKIATSLTAEGRVIRYIDDKANNMTVANEDAITYLNDYTSSVNPDKTANGIASQKINSTINIIALNSFTIPSSPATSEGSGFLISKDGYVLTNCHVINSQVSDKDYANKTMSPFEYVYGYFDNVRYDDGQYVCYRLEIVAYNTLADLAVLKFVNTFKYDTNQSGFPDWCAFENTAIRGESVVAIGNALALGTQVTSGVVSDTNSDYFKSTYGFDFIQTETYINRGNSGGPLFNLNGNVIGINTLKHSSTSFECIHWSVPTTEIIKFLDIVKSGKIEGTYITIKNSTLSKGISYKVF